MGIRSEYQELAERACQVAAKTAGVLRRDRSNLRSVTTVIGKDVKAVADERAHELMVAELEDTGFQVLSEEGHATDCVRSVLDGPCWVIDPLDGTLNYTRGFGVYAVSIAFWDGGAPRVGVIQDIERGTCYSGVIGEGASCDDEVVHVSAVSSVKDAVLATGFPTGRKYDADSLQKSISQIREFKKVRMIGSAAMSLAHVATGTFDAYHEEDIWVWDVAAGLALVKAAGGAVITSELKSNGKMDVTAWNGHFDFGAL